MLSFKKSVDKHCVPQVSLAVLPMWGEKLPTKIIGWWLSQKCNFSKIFTSTLFTSPTEQATRNTATRPGESCLRPAFKCVAKWSGVFCTEMKDKSLAHLFSCWFLCSLSLLLQRAHHLRAFVELLWNSWQSSLPLRPQQELALQRQWLNPLPCWQCQLKLTCLFCINWQIKMDAEFRAGD